MKEKFPASSNESATHDILLPRSGFVQHAIRDGRRRAAALNSALSGTTDDIDVTATATLTSSDILALIEDRRNEKLVEWTTRSVLRRLDLEPTKSRRRRCRKLLHDLWKDGQLSRKAAKRNNLEVVYCRRGIHLTEYCIPCVDCSFPVHVSNGVARDCIRCSGKPLGSGDPARIYLK